ncbi:MAG: 3-oxoacyl-ACP synthase [Gammaproteobacteria bacterium]|nr:MAG: 3-oxoacyl-ACP synthase [Gammaproteobacteria bacterium]
MRILGTGHVLPKHCVLSSEIDDRQGFPAGKTEKIGGVYKRYFAAPDETAAGLAAAAAHRALSAAGLTLNDIDCLVATSATMDQGMPSNAALVHAELGLSERGIPAFDINASCLGFLAALDSLTWMLTAGGYKRILLVAADLASCGLNWSDMESSSIFGDGAAAAILSKSDDAAGSKIFATSLKTYSEGVHYCEIPAGGSRYHPTRITQDFSPLTKFHMDGKKVFRLASQIMPDFMSQLLQAAGKSLADINWFVPHQASQLAIHHLTRRLNVAPEKVIDIFANHGNQVAASLPTALDIGIRDGRIKRGQIVLLIGTGAGLSMGGVVMEY